MGLDAIKSDVEVIGIEKNAGGGSRPCVKGAVRVRESEDPVGIHEFHGRALLPCRGLEGPINIWTFIEEHGFNCGGPRVGHYRRYGRRRHRPE